MAFGPGNIKERILSVEPEYGLVSSSLSATEALQKASASGEGSMPFLCHDTVWRQAQDVQSAIAYETKV